MFKKVLHTLSRTNVVVYFPIINMINYVSNLRITFSKRKDKKMWYACQYNKYLQFFYANNQRSKNSFLCGVIVIISNLQAHHTFIMFMVKKGF